MLRYSWGNHSDCCVDAKGIILTKADCARKLGVTRQTVQPVFDDLEARNCVRVTRRLGIFPLDDPNEEPTEGFSSSPNFRPTSEPLLTSGEDEANEQDFSDFVKRVWAKDHPDDYEEYQKAARKVKEMRARMLKDWREHKKAKYGPHLTSADFEVREGSDEESGEVPTSIIN